MHLHKAWIYCDNKTISEFRQYDFQENGTNKYIMINGQRYSLPTSYNGQKLIKVIIANISQCGWWWPLHAQLQVLINE